LRKQHGMAAMAILKFDEIKEKLSKGNVVIDDLYSWSEYLFLKEKFPDLVVIATFTKRSLRYERMASRPHRPYTKEELDSRDYTEINNIEKGGPIAIAGFTLINNSSIEELQKKVGLILKEIGFQ
ncbi:MAG: dephospho-CoA kinase, partial [archaeon]